MENVKWMVVGLMLAGAVVAKPSVDGTSRSSVGGASRSPNILLISLDDVGYAQLSCYNPEQVETPNIDQVAANGVRFTQAYATAPHCSPSRAGAMTGRYQTRFGHEDNHMGPGGGMPLSETTIAQRLKPLGYDTAICGKWHLGGKREALPIARGFDDGYGCSGNPGSFFTPGGIYDSRVSREVIKREYSDDYYMTDDLGDWSVEWLKRERTNPWFLYLAFTAIHSPFDVTEEYLDRFAHVENEDERLLIAMLAAADDAIGRVMDSLKKTGQLDNTLVFLISDNGSFKFPSGKNNHPLSGLKRGMWEGGLRPPFIMSWPGKLPAGEVVDTVISQLDILPTAVVAGGGTIDPAWELDGVDLMPFLTGKAKGVPHEALCWRFEGKWAVRSGDWKLMIDRADRKAARLFNLAEDIGEKKDLASAYPERVQRLQKIWDSWNAEQMPPRPGFGREKDGVWQWGVK